MFWTGDGKVLIAWDGGLGPTYECDPYGNPIKAKMLGPCQVWRALDPENTGDPAVCIGETLAEGFLDTEVENGSLVTYWCMEEVASGGLRQVGPTIDVEVPMSWERYDDQTAPSEVDDLACRRTGAGNLLTWLPASDDETGVLAYFVYDSNQDQPDSIVWSNPDTGDEDDPERAKVVAFLDRSDDGVKGYFVKAIDVALNLNEGVGPVTPSGDLLVCDLMNYVISRIQGTTVTTYTGAPRVQGVYEDEDGTLAEARFTNPSQMVTDSQGRVFIAGGYPGNVKMLDPVAETVTRFAGGTIGDWAHVDGPASTARFGYTFALGIDDDDQLYVGDQGAYLMRFLRGNDDDGWEVTTPAGKPGWYGCIDGEGVAEEVDISTVSATTYVDGVYRRTVTTATAHDFETDDTVTIYGVTSTPWPNPNTNTAVVTKIDSTSFTYDLPQGPGTARTGGHCFLRDSPTPAGRKFSLMDYPQGITYATNGNVYFTQYGNVVRELTLEGRVTTIAGEYGEYDYVNGQGAAARFNLIGDVVCVRNRAEPAEEYLLVADTENHVIRKVTLDGDVSLYLGEPAPWPAEVPTDVDGDLEHARLSYPLNLRLDGDDLYIGEYGYDENSDPWGVVRLWSGGVLTTIAGQPVHRDPADGEGADASFLSIEGIVVMSA